MRAAGSKTMWPGPAQLSDQTPEFQAQALEWDSQGCHCQLQEGHQQLMSISVITTYTLPLPCGTGSGPGPETVPPPGIPIPETQESSLKDREKSGPLT